MKKLLFICNQNINRSKTAEMMFKRRYETKSAGLFSDNPVSEKDISWADAVIVMEDSQRRELSKRFPALYMKKRILCMGIPDTYRYDQPELKQILAEKMSEIEESL